MCQSSAKGYNGDCYLPKNHEDAATFFSQGITNGNSDVVKCDIGCSGCCGIARFNLLSLYSGSPLNQNDGEAIFSLASDSKVISKTIETVS